MPWHRGRFPRGSAAFCGLCIALGLVASWPSGPAKAGTQSIVISEFRTRGPNGGNDEFIELYNRTNVPVDISGWRINGSNSAGETTTRLLVNPGTVMPAGGHFLATNPQPTGGPYSGSIPGDQTFSPGITDDGGIALLLPDGTIVDQVGMSVGSAYREGGPLTPMSATVNANQSYERRPGGASGNSQDTDNNAADFLFNPASSNPQNLASLPVLPPSSPSPTTGLAPTNTPTVTATRTATPPPTATVGLSATPTATCVSRPPVMIVVQPASGGRLLVTITANRNASAPANTLRELRFGNSPTATVDLANQPGFPIVPLPLGTTQTSFYLRQAAPGQPVTLSLDIVDDCGPWPTFVGGGLSAFATAGAMEAEPPRLATATALSSSATPTVTGSGVPTRVAAVDCQPRPNVGVRVLPAGPAGLQATVTAGFGSLVALEFGATTNALIDAGGQTGQAGNFTISVPPGTSQTTFLVQQLVPGRSTTVPLTVVDGCGRWPTLVGGGAEAFPDRAAFVFGNGVSSDQQVFIRSGIRMGVQYLGARAGVSADRDLTVYAYADLGQLVQVYAQVLAIPLADAQQHWQTSVAISGPGRIFVHTANPWWAGQATTADRVRLLVSEYQSVVDNKLASRFVGGTLDEVPAVGPWWLIDGVSGWTGWLVLDAYSLTPLSTARATLRAAAQGVTAHLQSMETLAGWQAAAGDHYMLAALVGDILMDTSPAALENYWTRIGQGLTWPAAFAAAFGRPVDVFYAQFEEYRRTVLPPQGRVAAIRRSGDCQWDVTLEVAGFQPNSAIQASNQASAYSDCQTGAPGTRSWGPIPAGVADATGRFTFSYRNNDYGTYHIVLKDASQRSIQLDTMYDRNFAGTP